MLAIYVVWSDVKKGGLLCDIFYLFKAIFNL